MMTRRLPQQLGRALGGAGAGALLRQRQGVDEAVEKGQLQPWEEAAEAELLQPEDVAETKPPATAEPKAKRKAEAKAKGKAKARQRQSQQRRRSLPEAARRPSRGFLPSKRDVG